MAIAFDSASVNNGTSSTSITVQHTCTGSNLVLLVAVSNYTSGSPGTPTVTYNGTSMTQIGTSQLFGAGNDERITLFGLVNPDTGSAYDIVATFGTSQSELVIGAVSYTGVDQTTAWSGPQYFTTDNVTTASVTVTSETGDLAVDFMSTYTPDNTVVGSGQTARISQDYGAATDSMYASEQAGATSVVLSWDWDTAQYPGQIGVNLEASTASDATPTPAALAATATFPALAGSASGAATALPATGTFDTVTVLLDQTPTPAALAGLVTFPTVAASATVDATPTLTALAGSATFDAVTAVGVDGVVAQPSPLVVQVGIPTVVVTYTFWATPTPSALTVTLTADTPTVSGGTSAVASATIVALTVTFTTPTVTYQINRTKTLTIAALVAVFPTASGQALELFHYYNTDVTIAVEVAFDDYPLAAAPTWYNITSDVRGFTIQRGRTNEFGEHQAGRATVHLDASSGDYDPTSGSSPYRPNVKPLKQVRIRAAYASTTYTLFRGFVESWPLSIAGFTDETMTLTAVDGFKILALAKDSTAQVEELSSTRVGNLLDEAGWPASLRTIGTGVATVPAYTPSCGTSLSLIKQVSDSEAGQFYISAAGHATFRNRTYRSGLSSVATFGPAAGQIPYADIRLAYDDTQVWNQVQVNIGGFPSILAESTASQDNYGVRTLAVNEILLPNSTDGDDLAVVYLNRYKEPLERIEQIRVLPERSPTLAWPQVLGLDLSSKVTVRYVSKAGNVTALGSYIEHIAHAVTLTGGRRWQTTYTLTQHE